MAKLASDRQMVFLGESESYDLCQFKRPQAIIR